VLRKIKRKTIKMHMGKEVYLSAVYLDVLVPE
jgi:hypothetical protein